MPDILNATFNRIGCWFTVWRKTPSFLCAQVPIPICFEQRTVWLAAFLFLIFDFLVLPSSPSSIKNARPENPERAIRFSVRRRLYLPPSSLRTAPPARRGTRVAAFAALPAAFSPRAKLARSVNTNGRLNGAAVGDIIQARRNLSRGEILNVQRNTSGKCNGRL